MPREVNIFLGNWTALGSTAPVSRYSIQIQHDWTDNVGAKHTDTRTLTFPNALSGIPLARLKDYMERIILEEARIQLGVDN